MPAGPRRDRVIGGRKLDDPSSVPDQRLEASQQVTKALWYRSTQITGATTYCRNKGANVNLPFCENLACPIGIP